jgi:hypothetical protein
MLQSCAPASALFTCSSCTVRRTLQGNICSKHRPLPRCTARRPYGSVKIATRTFVPGKTNCDEEGEIGPTEIYKRSSEAADLWKGRLVPTARIVNSASAEPQWTPMLIEAALDYSRPVDNFRE